MGRARGPCRFTCFAGHCILSLGHPSGFFTMIKFRILPGLLLGLLFAVSYPSFAAKAISKQQAATIARSKFQGRVIAVDKSKHDSTPVYRVKVLDKKGGMHTIVIDHQSGNILSAH
jgi:hypothetical protein